MAGRTLVDRLRAHFTHDEMTTGQESDVTSSSFTDCAFTLDVKNFFLLLLVEKKTKLLIIFTNLKPLLFSFVINLISSYHIIQANTGCARIGIM